MTTQNKNEQQKLWDEIESFGGPKEYVDAQLKQRGVEIVKRENILRYKRTYGQAAFEKYLSSRAKEESVRDTINKQVWAAYKATHVVELGDGIFWSDHVGVDFFDPHDRYQRVEDNQLPKMETVSELVKHLQEAVPELDVPMLRWYCYNRDVAETVHYRSFSFPKKSGGVRYIWAPMPNMKAMQNWILKNVLERLTTHNAAHGFIRNRSIVSNANVHCNSQVVVGMDIKDFFPTFTFKRVKGIFRSAGYLEGISTLLALICTESPRRPMKIKDEESGEEKWVHVATGPRCLPQGSPASPMLTNVACVRLDRRLTGFAEKYGWRYTRYADDLTFSLPAGATENKDAAWLISRVSKIVADEGFAVHPDKTSIMGTGVAQEVTGLVVNGDYAGPRVPRKLREMLRAAIHNQEQGKEFHENESWHTLMGYASFVFSATPDKGRALLERLQGLLENLDTSDNG